MEVIYTRQSREKKDSISIETQIEFCKRELSNSEDFKLYEDKGYSGGNIDRPDFRELMRDVKAGLITKVIVYRLDRISRSILNFTYMMEIFNKYGVEFISCNEKLDTTTPAGRMVINILIVFAQFERESAQQRITDNYYERAKMGVFLGGNLPYGYGKDTVKIAGKKTSMLIKNEQSKIVQKIFDMHTNGMTLGEIAMFLNSNNIHVGKNNKGCHSNTISRILRNPVYAKADYNTYHFLDMKNCIIHNEMDDFNSVNGLICYGEGDTKFRDITGYNISIGLHEGIIDSDTWLKAQYRVYDNKQIANNGTSQNTWLSGISKCGNCGYAMTYKSVTKKLKKGTKTYKHLRCSGKTYKRCDGELNYIQLSNAEESVFDALVKHIKDMEIKIVNDNNGDNIKNLELELLSINTKIEKLVNSLTESNEITMHYINKSITALHNQKQQINNEIIKHEKKRETDMIINAKEYINNWESLSVDSKKRFAQTYIEQIRFYANEIKIDFL